MKPILFPFMVLAAIGFVLSVAAHVVALAGLPIPGGQAVFGLHVGIFVVWFPTVLVSIRTTRFADRNDFWNVALSGCPAWMRNAFYAVFAYAIVNFVVFMFASSTGGRPPVKSLASEVRGFSGHWMVFYAAAFTTLYSVIRSPNLLRERKCRQGHAVSPTARFCPKCGESLAERPEDV